MLRLPQGFHRCLAILTMMGGAAVLAACGGGGAAGTAAPVAPSISTQPQNVSVTDGQAASFSVAAGGGTALSYQWQRNGVNIGGATAASYSIPAVVYPDNGAQFRVIVTDSGGAGTVISTLVTLTVIPVPPAIVIPPASISVAAGATAPFIVTASGSAPLKYQWTKKLAGSSTGLPIVGATFARHENANSLPADDGAQFIVVVTNGAGQSVTSAAATLTVVTVAPFIVTQPQSQTVVAPASASYVVVANGTPPLTFQWYKNGTLIPGATNASYTTPATSIPDSGSLFHVVVSHGSLTVTSADAALTVNVAPVAPSISVQPQSVSVQVGAAAIFTVTAGGSAPLTYQWRRNGVNIVGATSATYTLSPVAQLDDQASFSVIVNNVTNLPVTSSAAVLTVTLPPGGIDLLAGHLGGAGSLEGTGGAARLRGPEAVATNAAGDVFVADTYNSAIRRISPTGVVSTLAGNPGKPGSADGTGTTAQFNYPQGIAADAAGNVYVVDTDSYTIRLISPTGLVTTLAGVAGSFGSTNGIGAAARFAAPQGIVADTAGNLYVADTGNNIIRKINASSGAVTTLAGTAGVTGSADSTGAAAQFNNPQSVAVDGAGNVYVTDTDNNTIRMITAGGVVSTLAGAPGVAGVADGTGNLAQFDHPKGIVADAAGNVYVSDTNNATIRRITPGGVVTTMAGTAFVTGTADGLGSAAHFANPLGMALDAAGNLYVADFVNATVRKISVTAAVTTLAGKAAVAGDIDATGSAALFNSPQGTAVDAAGNILVADTGNNIIRKVNATSGAVITLAGASGVTGSNDGTGTAAQFSAPWGLAADTSGNVYVADMGNAVIRKISSGGAVTTLAGSAGATGTTDGTGSAARFNAPQAVATDASGNVYVADTGNSVIRKITPAGVVTTLAGTAGAAGTTDGTGAAARFDHPQGVVTDASGNVYVADSGNYAVRKIDPAGVVTTLAGVTGQAGHADGTGAAARFDVLVAIAIDAAGNLYVMDSVYHQIRKITPAGVVTTAAGDPDRIGVMLGALPGGLNGPTAIAVLPGSTVKLVVPDAAENSVLLITLP
jgi:sugar lactone lactonase YvrE